MADNGHLERSRIRGPRYVWLSHLALMWRSDEALICELWDHQVKLRSGQDRTDFAAEIELDQQIASFSRSSILRSTASELQSAWCLKREFSPTSLSEELPKKSALVRRAPPVQHLKTLSETKPLIRGEAELLEKQLKSHQPEPWRALAWPVFAQWGAGEVCGRMRCVVPSIWTDRFAVLHQYWQ